MRPITSFLLGAALMLASCATTVPFVPDPDQREALKLNIDPELKKECPALPTGLKLTEPEHVLAAYARAATAYGNCRDRNRKLIELIKRIEGAQQ